MLEVARDDSSPPTFPATEPRTTAQKTFKGCKCAAHQRIYDNWPTHDAELTIAKCMTVCVCCGADYRTPPRLRIHLKMQQHAQNKHQRRPGNKGKRELHHAILDAQASYGSRQPCSNHPRRGRHKQNQRRRLPMIGRDVLRILQYNVNKSKDVALASLFQDRWIVEYDVIAIQS